MRRADLEISSVELYAAVQGFERQDVCDILTPSQKNELSRMHNADRSAKILPNGDPGPKFIEIGWGRVFYEIGQDGTIAVIDADDRVSFHKLPTVRVYRSYPGSSWVI